MYKKPSEPRIFFFIVLVGTSFVASTFIINERVLAEPMLSVEADCRIEQGYIDGKFNASGFRANTLVEIEARNDSYTQLTMYTEPVGLLNTKNTDSMGNVNGSFIINSSIGPGEFSEYFLSVISIDNPRALATASLDIC